MSSHHIIRENQEPALIILEKINSELLGQICEWSPGIYVSEELLDWILDKNIKVDCIFGSEDLKEESLLKVKHQMPVNYLIINSSEIKEIMSEINNSEIYVTSANIEFLGMDSEKRIILINDEFKGFRKIGIWRKWKKKGSKIEIQGNISSTQNLKEQVDGKYEVKSKGIAEVKSESYFTIKEYY